MDESQTRQATSRGSSGEEASTREHVNRDGARTRIVTKAPDGHARGAWSLRERVRSWWPRVGSGSDTGSLEGDWLGEFAERVARARTSAEVRSALMEAARRLGGPRVWSGGSRRSLEVAVPMSFGGRSLGTIRLGIDMEGWSEARKARLTALASLAAAAEMALGGGTRGGAGEAPQTVKDPATGLPTAAFLEMHLGQALALAKRRKESLCLLAVSVKGLDRIRRQDGEEFADLALGLASRAVSGSLRASDLVARLEGDCLAAVLPGASKGDAERLGEVIRRALVEAGVASSVPTALTALVGVAGFPDDAHTPRALREACEQSLRERSRLSRMRSSVRSALDIPGGPR